MECLVVPQHIWGWFWHFFKENAESLTAKRLEVVVSHCEDKESGRPKCGEKGFVLSLV